MKSSGPLTSKVLETSQKSETSEPTEITHKLLAHSPVLRSNSWNAAIVPRRPGLVHVISVSSIAFIIALICGLMISYMIHQLAKAEEKQQLAALYENVEIPLLDEKELSEDDGNDEFSEPHPDNEELGNFIGSVIRTKRKESILKKKMKREQNLQRENTSESFNYVEKVEDYDKMEKDEKEGNL